jgi:hypothetical protein
MEGNTLKTSTTSDRSPRRSRTKSLIGVLAATALLAGAMQALAPAWASAMSDMTAFICKAEGNTWNGLWCEDADDDGFGGSTGSGQGSWNTGPGAGPQSAGKGPVTKDQDLRGCHLTLQYDNGQVWLCPQPIDPADIEEISDPDNDGSKKARHSRRGKQRDAAGGRSSGRRSGGGARGR